MSLIINHSLLLKIQFHELGVIYKQNIYLFKIVHLDIIIFKLGTVRFRSKCNNTKQTVPETRSNTQARYRYQTTHSNRNGLKKVVKKKWLHFLCSYFI